MSDGAGLIIMNEDAFDLTREQTAAIRNTDRLWNYFKDEAEYSAESDPQKRIDHEDIIVSVLNSGTIWKENGLVHLTDFDSNRFEYVWNEADDEGPGRWVSVK